MVPVPGAIAFGVEHQAPDGGREATKFEGATLCNWCTSTRSDFAGHPGDLVPSTHLPHGLEHPPVVAPHFEGRGLQLSLGCSNVGHSPLWMQIA